MTGRRPGRGAVRLLAGAGAVVALVAGAGPATTAAATTASPATAAAATVELERQTTWVRPGETFDVDVRITDAPPGAQLDMVVHEGLRSRRELRTAAGGDLGPVEHRVPARPVAALPAGQAGTVTARYDPGAPGTRVPSRGVYPVEVRLLTSEGEPIDGITTYMTYLKGDTTGFTPLKLAVVIDVGARPSIRPDGTPDVTTSARDRARERAALLAGVTGVPLTLAPVPETIEALAGSGPEGAAIVETLRGAARPGQVVGRPFVDVDLAGLRHAGLLEEGTRQVQAGAGVARTHLGVEPVSGIWLSEPTLGARAAGLMDDLGFGAAVVPPTAVADPGPGAMTPVRLTPDGPLTMVSDADLASHLTSRDGMVAAHRFVAELAITWLERPADPRAAVIRLPAGARLDLPVVTAALEALGQAAVPPGEVPPVDVVPLGEMFDGLAAAPPPDSGRVVAAEPHEIDDRLTAVAAPLVSARARVEGVGSILNDPEVGTSLEHSLLLSTGTDTPDDARRAYIDRVEQALGSVMGVVALPEEFRITLTTRSSTIPVTLTNLSDEALRVRVELEGDQLEFPEGDVFVEDLPPGTLRLDVPVRTRTSGAFTLHVTVTSPDGTIVLDRSTFDVRSTVISGVGIVLSIGASLFLAVWWARHWRTSRRSRHLVAAEASGDDGVPADAPAEVAPAYRPAHMAGHRPRSG